MPTIIKKYWLLFLFLALGVASLVVDGGVRTTLSRRRELRQAQNELRLIEGKIRRMEQKLAQLENHPETYENLIRSELGYIRPGEKEIRIRTRR